MFPRLARGTQFCAVSCFRGSSVEQRTLVSQWRALRGYGAGGERRKGLSGGLSLGNVLWENEQNFRGTHHWPQSKVGAAGTGLLLLAAASWMSTRGLDTRVSLPGLWEGSPISWSAS